MLWYRREGVVLIWFFGMLYCFLSAAFASEQPRVYTSSATQSPVEYMTEPPAGSFISFSHDAMATRFRIVFYTESKNVLPGDYERIAQEAFDLIDDLEARLSRYRPNSEVAAINNRASLEPVKVSVDLLELLTIVRGIYQDTAGAFDPTVGPLLKVWGFYKQTGVLPTENQIGESLKSVGFDKVVVDLSERTVAFTQPGMMLDLGGTAKGFALDRVAELLKSYGVTTAALDAGTSSVVLMGTPPGMSGWTVRLRHPYKQETFIAEVCLHDTTFSASGLGERYVEINGKKYGHIFDPRTGYPVEGFASTVAIAPQAAVSDALSTAFFVMGEENVRKYINRRIDVRAILVPASENGEAVAIKVNFPESEGQS